MTEKMNGMMKLYAMPTSGNSYKVAWMLNLCQKKFELIPTSSLDGSTRTPEFLAKNPNGQVPLLELEDGRRLAESNAQLMYLAEQTSMLLPSDPYQRGLTYQWLFFEQYTHEPAIAVRRTNLVFNRPCTEEKMQQLLEKGYKALSVMEAQLSKTPYMAGDSMTIADIALYAYTHCAHEGEYEMDKYPKIQEWLERVRQSPGYCGMDVMEKK